MTRLKTIIRGIAKGLAWPSRKAGIGLAWAANAIEGWSVAKFIKSIEPAAILIAIVAFAIELGDRREEREARAWQLLSVRGETPGVVVCVFRGHAIVVQEADGDRRIDLRSVANIGLLCLELVIGTPDANRIKLGDSGFLLREGNEAILDSAGWGGGKNIGEALKFMERGKRSLHGVGAIALQHFHPD